MTARVVDVFVWDGVKMLSFVQGFLAPKCNPIGIDFGSDCLRLAQVQRTGAETKLIAAAHADVPPHVRHDPVARLNFFTETVKELIPQGKFRSRQAVLGLPASSMFIQHLRMAKIDDDAMKKALPWELRGKLPIDPTHALLRHVIAGDVYEGQEPKSEVIVIAAAREMVNSFLASAAKAKLDIVGMNIEPKALVDCFSQLYRRKTDEGVINCYVDIGCVSTRTVVARGTDIFFARTIPVGGDHFSRAVSNALKIKLEEAKLLRAKIAQTQQAVVEEKKETPAPLAETSIENSFALLPSGVSEERRAPDLSATTVSTPDEGSELARQIKQVEQACRDPLARVVEELELCRRYYETTFPQQPIQRLIFVGGEARQKALCQHIAKAMGLAAQVGDPMSRLVRGSDVELEKIPQPNWAVAIGLSMGPAGAGKGAASGAEVASKG